MAKIIPGVPPAYDGTDLRGTVKKLCDYMRIFQENVDFQLVQLKKEADSIGEELEDIKDALNEHELNIGALCDVTSQLSEE